MMDALPLVSVWVAPRTAARVAEVSKACALPPSQLLEQALDVWTQHNMSLARPRRSFDLPGSHTQQTWAAGPGSLKRTIWNSSSIPEDAFHRIPDPAAVEKANATQSQPPTEQCRETCLATIEAKQPRVIETYDLMDLEDGLLGIRCSETGWESLPSSIAQQLFGSLPRPSAATARSVCSSWSDYVLQNTTSLSVDWPAPYLGMCNLSKLPMLAELSLSCRSDSTNPQLQPVVDMLSQTRALQQTSLDLSSTSWQLGPQHMDVLGGMTKLTGLSIRRTYPPSASLSFLSSLTRLTSLSVSCCSMEPKSLPLLFSALPQLTELDWSNNLFRGPLPEGHLVAGALRKLSLSNCDVSDEALGYLGRVTSLRSLDLSILPHCTRTPRGLRSDVFLSNVGLRRLTRLVSLTELRLQNQIQVSSEGLRQLQGLPCLAALDLSGCVSLLDDGDLQGVGALTSLKELSLQAVNNNIVAPTPVSFLAPLSTLRNLSRLDLSDNWGYVSLEALAPLAELPGLTSLDIGEGNEGHVLQSPPGGVYRPGELLALLNAASKLLPLISADSRCSSPSGSVY